MAETPTCLRALKLVGGGRALAHRNDATWMVRGALPGEQVEAVVTRRRARVVEAEVVAVTGDRHPSRLVEPCPRSPQCGGCDWPHVEPAAGAELKREVAAEAAARFPAIADRLREAHVKSSPPGYRIRNRLHWDPRRGLLGFYGHRSRRVSIIDECRIITPALATVLPTLTNALAGACPAPVDLETLEGDKVLVAALRPARGGPAKVRQEWLPGPECCPGLAGLHRLSPSGRVRRGWGRDHVTMELPVPLQVPVGSFFQGNRHLIPWLFRRVVSIVGAGSEDVFDLHGGVGFLAAAARHAGRTSITVVEPHRGAADAARHNLPGAEVVAATAEAFLASSGELPHRALVITDPPRTGLTRRLREELVAWRPSPIVMLGCDPATWSRDANHLFDADYRLTDLELVDLFPFTHHVEILARLVAT